MPKCPRGATERADNAFMDPGGSERIIRGVETEVYRTLPFWRCFLELKYKFRHTPIIESLDTSITHKEPCSVFSGVDVVWATTTAILRVQTEKAEASVSSRIAQRKCSREDSAHQLLSPHNRKNSARSWRHIPSQAFTYHLGTIHFVHHDPTKPGWERSYHIQSVHLYENPQQMQCVAGVMTHFSLLLYSSQKLMEEAWQSRKSIWRVRKEVLQIDDGTDGKLRESKAALKRLSQFFLPPTSRVLILGMGGNSMAIGLRYLLGESAHIEVVELEPAVVRTCRAAGTLLDEDTRITAHVEDATVFLEREWKARQGNVELFFDMVFLDLFEPVGAKMAGGDTLVRRCYQLMKEDGFLVANEHHLPDPKQLIPFTEVFGDGQVHAVNLRGWNESIVVGFKKSTSPSTSLPSSSTSESPNAASVSLACSLQTMGVVQDFYDAWLSTGRPSLFSPKAKGGDVPENPSDYAMPRIKNWLLGMKTFNKAPYRCRIWSS